MSPLNPVIQFRKMVYLPPELLTQWQKYKQQHPDDSFNRVVGALLTAYLTRHVTDDE